MTSIEREGRIGREDKEDAARTVTEKFSRNYSVTRPAVTVKMVEDFLSANQLYTGRYDRLWKELEMHRVAEQADARGIERDGCRISQVRLGVIWTWLNRAHAAGTLRNWA